jgi:cell division protein FtsQ
VTSPFAFIGRHAWLVSSVCIALGLVLGQGYMLVRPDLLLVEHVEFEGCSETQKAGLRHLADVPNGSLIWSVDTDEVAAAVERHPWVKSASVSRQWPSTLVVAIEERRPVALIRKDVGLWYVEEDGTIFQPAHGHRLDLPVLSGLNEELSGRHPHLSVLVVRDALRLIDTLESEGLVGRDEVSEVVFSEARGFTVLAGNAEVVFGFERFPEQAQRLAALFNHGVALESRLHIDLGPDTVAIVRPLDAPGVPFPTPTPI